MEILYDYTRREGEREREKRIQNKGAKCRSLERTLNFQFNPRFSLVFFLSTLPFNSLFILISIFHRALYYYYGLFKRLCLLQLY